MAGTNPEPVLAQAGFVPLTPAEPCWFTPAEIWPMISASEGLNLMSSLCLTQHGDIPTSQTPGCPSLPSAVANIPIPANLLTAAWQEQKPCWAARPTDWLGWPWGVTQHVFRRWEGSMGVPIHALTGAAFKTSPTGHQFLKTSSWDFLHKEEGSDPSKGFSSCLVWMCSWSGGAGERRVWGPCLPHTTAWVLGLSITSPSCWLALPPCFSTPKLPFLEANMEWADSHSC